MTSDVKDYIAQVGFDPVYGARPLKRALYEVIEDKLADLILEDKITSGNKVSFDYKEDKVVVEIK